MPNEYYTGKYEFCVPRYIMDILANIHSAFLGHSPSKQDALMSGNMCSSSIRKKGITNHYHDLLSFSDYSIMTSAGQEHKFSNLTAALLWSNKWLWSHQGWHPSVTHNRSDVQKAIELYFLPVKKQKQALNSTLKQGQDLSIIQCKGFSISL